MTLRVVVSDIAAPQIEDIVRRAKADPRGHYVSFWEALGKLLERLGDPAVALAKNTVLERRKHDLTPVRRLKYGPSGRLLYIANAGYEELVVLQLGYRIPGDPKDAYEELHANLKAGVFDLYITRLGLSRKR